MTLYKNIVVQPKQKESLIDKVSRQVELGVTFSFKELTFVLASQSLLGDWRVLDYKKVPLPDELDKDSVAFPSFLKNALLSFLGKRKGVKIWSTIQSNKVETQIFEIQNISAGKIANAALWAYKKNSSFNPAQSIFDFKVIGKIVKKEGTRLRILGYTAPKDDIFKLRTLFHKAGYPLTGVSVVIFAIQNIIKKIVDKSTENNQCFFFVGKDWSRIDIFENAELAFSRDIKTGTNSLLQSIRESQSNESQSKE